MAANIARDLAGAAGMADVDRVLEVEQLDEFGEVVGVSVVIVTDPGLTGTAVSATVESDGAIAV